jgi:two-component system sensor histidine kinase KdpD
VRARAVRSLARRQLVSGTDGEDLPLGQKPRGDRVIVRIVDRGPGIPPAQLERVFQPFYRAGTAGGEHRGSGLGLAIARGFAESNGGTLCVESLPSQGATFVFEFPLEQPESQTADAGAPLTDAAGERRQPVARSAGGEPAA